MTDLVTGEAVVLDLRLARLASRGLAMALDVLLQLVGLLVVAVPLFMTPTSLDTALRAALGLTAAVAVLVGYPVICETLSRGRTLGKLAMGLRVVRDDGGPIRFRHALVRGLAGFFVDFWALGFLGAVAVFVSLSSATGKRVGDYLAGTLVIRERLPVREASPVRMPPQLTGWAATLPAAALAAVSDDLALAVRQYLLRFDQLNAGAREALGARLAGEVSERMAVPVPPGSHASDYLAAVLAERGNRERTAGPVAPTEPAPRPVDHPAGDNPFAPPG